jgi:hypothetical protein
MPWLSDNREKKKIARERVFSCGPRKSVLLLPGYRCECAKLALQREVVTENSVCTFVEKEEETITQIRRWIRKEWKLTVPPIIHQGELSSLKMHPIDLGYVDLFGNLTKLELDWIQNQLVPNLMPGCNLAFTFSFPLRGNDFVKRGLMTMNDKYFDLYKTKLKSLEEIDDQVRPLAAFYDIIFSSLLSDHSYQKDFLSYKDGKIHTMLLVMFTNIRKNPEKLLQDFRSRMNGVPK